MRVIPGKRGWSGQRPQHERVYSSTPTQRLLSDLWSEGRIGRLVADVIVNTSEIVQRIIWRWKNGGK